jgi:hypothetical protein
MWVRFPPGGPDKKPSLEHALCSNRFDALRQRSFGSRQSGSNDKRAAARSLGIAPPSREGDPGADIPEKRRLVLVASRTTTKITGIRHNIPIQKSTSKKFMALSFRLTLRCGRAAARVTEPKVWCGHPTLRVWKL